MRPRRNPGRRRVYPRVCGGTELGLSEQGREEGLSPRVRGNPALAISSMDSIRSIPACAGEPCARAVECPPGRVYPRVCGGTFVGYALPMSAIFLSPRVRGNLVLVLRVDAGDGSIPACAGEPSGFM